MLGKKMNQLRQRRSRSNSNGQHQQCNKEEGLDATTNASSRINNNYDYDDDDDENGTIDTAVSSHTPVPVPTFANTQNQQQNSSNNSVTTESLTSQQQQQEQRTRKLRHMSSADSGVSDTDAMNPTTALTGEQVKKDESRSKKILQRTVLGLCMFIPFCGILYAGHLYICLLVALIETTLFLELVRVRYKGNYATIQDQIPLFRTTQWMWFAVAMFFNYGDFITDIVQNNQELHYLLPYVKFTGSLSFVLYSTTLMVTISTLQREHVRFQINQLCWTIVVLCLTLGQLKYVMHNIYNGLIWFVLPVCLVIINDIMAYVAGMSMGRKFISRPFISFSPNKTWEGFIGGGVFTLISAWYLSKFLAQYTWMTCPARDFRLVPESLDCIPDPIFMPAHWIFPSQIFELFPRNFVRTLPGVVQICSTVKEALRQQEPAEVTSDDSDAFLQISSPLIELEPCISGNDRQLHSHFELVVEDDFYPIQVHALWLALFASVVSPFGGFLASAIKRAYGIKDFAALIPGHGGLMDRMDCQFLMALCTWVHYNTFVKLATVSVPKLSYLFSLLTEKEQAEFLKLLQKQHGSEMILGNE